MAKKMSAAKATTRRSLKSNRTRPLANRLTRSKKAAPKRLAKRSTLGSIGIAVRGTAAEAVAAVAKTVSRRPPADAITLLKSDHRKMEALLKRGEGTTERAVERRVKLLDTITEELALHETLEERVFYPGLGSHPEARDIVLEGFEEHHAADVIVKELHRVAANNEKWTAKFKVLQETIQHHIDEEEGQMFRTARAVLSRKELAEMATKMAGLKQRTKRR